MHHITNPLLDLGESHRLTAVVEHSNNGVGTSEHLSQELVLVWQCEAGGLVLGQGVVALVGWHITVETSKKLNHPNVQR